MVTELGVLTQCTSPQQFFLLASVEEQTLKFGPMSDSARRSKDRTEKQNTGSITSQRNHSGIDIQTQEEPWCIIQEEGWRPAKELPKPFWTAIDRCTEAHSSSQHASEDKKTTWWRLRREKVLGGKGYKVAWKPHYITPLLSRYMLYKHPFKSLKHQTEYVHKSYGFSVEICT